MTYNHELLEAARESRGLTQQQLASRLGIAQGTWSKMELGLRPISEDLLIKAADCLGYRPDFFVSDERLYGFGVSEIFHRKRYDVGIKRLRAIYAQVNIRRIQIAKMLKAVDIVDPRFPCLEVGEQDRKTASDRARTLRVMWNLPLGPVRNVVRTVEDAGGIVVPFDFGSERIDAVSQCIVRNGLYLFFVSMSVPTDRLRFTLMHEVGHIIMHATHPNLDSAEREADLFASEFLMPAREIKPHLSGLTLEKLARLKPYWKVSMGALLYRATQLGTITANQARYLWAQLTAKGYKTREPVELDLPAEQPTLYEEIIATYRKDMHYSVREFSKVIGLGEEETRQEFYVDRRGLSVVR